MANTPETELNDLPNSTEQVNSGGSSRRKFLVGSGIVVASAFMGYRWFTRGPATFDTSAIVAAGRLPIPELIEDRGDGINLVAAAGTTEFIEGAAMSTTWGFNRAFLGPTIRVRKGQAAKFAVSNELDEVITSHWHGLAIPGAIDGGPFNLVESGESWDFTMDVVQQASTNWYHSHVHGSTGRHVNLGLAGMFIVDDDNSDGLDLPSTYGVDDIPLIVQDRTFLEDGSMLGVNAGRGVFFGETVVVNGAIVPLLELQAKRNRLRLLNAANGRVFNFLVSNGSQLTKIATEGGFLNAPVDVNNVRMSPGERAEVILDLTDYDVGDELTLRSLNVGGNGALDDEFDVLRIRVVAPTLDNPALPETMNDVPDAAELLASVDVVATRDFALGGNAINDDAFVHGSINHVTQRGTWELWNVTGGQHPFHVHGASFLVVPNEGQAQGAAVAGWRDTVNVGQGVQLLIRFEHEAPPEATYMYHCHLMGHEDAGMMGQFAVVDDPNSVSLTLAAETSETAATPNGLQAADKNTSLYCDLNGSGMSGSKA